MKNKENRPVQDNIEQCYNINNMNFTARLF